MGRETFGIPAWMAECLVEGLGLTGAVETGTYTGDSSRFLSTLVDDVWTIELSPTLHAKAIERHGDVPGIHFLLGDSAARLPEIVAELRGPVLYWLDAHWCEGETAGADDTIPLQGELETIDASASGADSVILIDDADFFLGGPWQGYGAGRYPSFIEVADRLRAHHPRYVTVLDDVIMAGPPSARAVIEQRWMRERSQRNQEREELAFSRSKIAELEAQLAAAAAERAKLVDSRDIAVATAQHLTARAESAKSRTAPRWPRRRT
jgi:hypothetical protein